MEDKVLIVIQFGVELIRLWVGMFFLFRAKVKRVWLGIIGYALFMILSFLCNIQLLPLILLMWSFVIVICFLTIMLPEGRNWKWKIFDIFILMYLEELINMMMDNMAICRWKTVSDYELEFFYSIINFIFIGFISYIFQKSKKIFISEKFTTCMGKSMIPMIVFLCIGIMLIIVGFNYLITQSDNEQHYVLGGILSSLSMSCIGVLAVVVFYVKNTNDKLNEMLIMEKKLKQIQCCYYETLLEKEEATRRYRHDMNNHFICLDDLVNTGNIEGAKAYIKEMKKQIENIRNYSFYTGNQILDALLNYYLTKLQPDVLVSVEGRFREEIAISDIDMCTIFGNLIQNAIESIQNCKQSKTFLLINIQSREKLAKIEIKNSMEPNDICIDENKKIITTKRDKRNHGIGILNVKEAVLKNRGLIDFYIEESLFCCRVILPTE